MNDTPSSSPAPRPESMPDEVRQAIRDAAEELSARCKSWAESQIYPTADWIDEAFTRAVAESWPVARSVGCDENEIVRCLRKFEDGHWALYYTKDRLLEAMKNTRLPEGKQIVSEAAISWLHNSHPDIYKAFYELVDLATPSQTVAQEGTFGAPTPNTDALRKLMSDQTFTAQAAHAYLHAEQLERQRNAAMSDYDRVALENTHIRSDLAAVREELARSHHLNSERASAIQWAKEELEKTRSALTAKEAELAEAKNALQDAREAKNRFKTAAMQLASENLKETEELHRQINELKSSHSLPTTEQGAQRAGSEPDGTVGTLLTMPSGLNAMTRKLVKNFAAALAEKLFQAEQKYGYSDGWTEAGWIADGQCAKRLREHTEKGDPRDVAAYCAFLWWHKASTKLPSQPTPSARAREDFRQAIEDGLEDSEIVESNETYSEIATNIPKRIDAAMQREDKEP